ncbi:MAG: hypothetical protein HUK40_16665 [Desulfobacter sp.]|nr:hypothetical protein [Desulfobacter sp.]
MDIKWDGHVKLYTQAVFPRSGTVYAPLGLAPNFDGAAEFRLNNQSFFTETLYTEIHYEAMAGGGGSRKDSQDLAALYPNLFFKGLWEPPNDDSRFFDLTAVVHEGRSGFSYHRLDRALVSFSPAWGEFKIGRQALTWGHGFTFNPMDLFNPFAPTDLEREYKTGDDMALVRFPVGQTDVELVYVARKDPDTGKTGAAENSFGAKLHFFTNTIEMDIVVTRHYEDYVAGVGATGNLGGAAYRWDVTATFLKENSRGKSAYISGVANLDYSWVWLDKNWYGYVELYYNGLSNNNYQDVFTDSAIFKRVARGELFALGRIYASASVNLEIHPLVNLYLTPILNLYDGSGILLPRIVYDWADNICLSVSGALNFGKTSTEYGGYEIPNTVFTTQPSDSIAAWVTWYF